MTLDELKELADFHEDFALTLTECAADEPVGSELEKSHQAAAATHQRWADELSYLANPANLSIPNLKS